MKRILNLLLYVSDNGCGIPPEVLTELEASESRTPGKHLGMFNVDNILRLRYGEGYGLTAQSVPGEGSRVCLTLPLIRKESTNAESPDR